MEKTADEQGLIRGAQQSHSKADGGAIIGRCVVKARGRARDPPAADREVTGLGNACCLRGLAAFSRVAAVVVMVTSMLMPMPHAE